MNFDDGRTYILQCGRWALDPENRMGHIPTQKEQMAAQLRLLKASLQKPASHMPERARRLAALRRRLENEKLKAGTPSPRAGG